MKECKQCGILKKKTNFYLEGRGRGDGFRAKCKECSNDQKCRDRSKLWKKNNPKQVKIQKGIAREKLCGLGSVYIKRSIRSAIARARKKGYQNYDSKEDLYNYLMSIGGVPKKCPILGLDLVYGGGSSGNSPSLDRIDVTKGYVVGNVWYISARANMMKNNASFKELQKFSKYFINNFTSWGKKRKKD